MRLVPFDWNKKTESNPRPVFVACMACGEMIRETDDGVADLDGPSFRAYYHAQHVPTEETTEKAES